MRPVGARREVHLPENSLSPGHDAGPGDLRDVGRVARTPRRDHWEGTRSRFLLRDVVAALQCDALAELGPPPLTHSLRIPVMAASTLVRSPSASLLSLVKSS